jgi:hypothetical protein
VRHEEKRAPIRAQIHNRNIYVVDKPSHLAPQHCARDAGAAKNAARFCVLSVANMHARAHNTDI